MSMGTGNWLPKIIPTASSAMRWYTYLMIILHTPLSRAPCGLLCLFQRVARFAAYILHCFRKRACLSLFSLLLCHERAQFSKEIRSHYACFIAIAYTTTRLYFRFVFQTATYVVRCIAKTFYLQFNALYQ